MWPAWHSAVFFELWMIRPELYFDLQNKRLIQPPYCRINATEQYFTKDCISDFWLTLSVVSLNNVLIYHFSHFTFALFIKWHKTEKLSVFLHLYRVDNDQMSDCTGVQWPTEWNPVSIDLRQASSIIPLCISMCLIVALITELWPRVEDLFS